MSGASLVASTSSNVPTLPSPFTPPSSFTHPLAQISPRVPLRYDKARIRRALEIHASRETLPKHVMSESVDNNESNNFHPEKMDCFFSEETVERIRQAVSKSFSSMIQKQKKRAGNNKKTEPTKPPQKIRSKPRQRPGSTEVGSVRRSVRLQAVKRVVKDNGRL